jgi:hypothetical protein
MHVKQLALIESITCQDVNWINLATDMDQCSALLKTAMNLRSEFATDFLKS